MDPLSQAALGAAVAHGIFHRRLGWKAAVWGAVAGAAPDIDILFSIGADEFHALETHRGITHSLFFAPVVGPIWGAWIERRARVRGAPVDPTRMWAWIGAITLALLSHPLLDYFTPYGTQLLQPFSDARFAWPAMPIIDPVYTLILLAGLAIAWRTSPKPLAGVASLAGVLLSSAYIGWGAWLNASAREFARADLAARGIENAEVSAYPTILQIHYRRVVARTEDEDLAGYVSMWEPCAIDWGRAPRQDGELVERALATREGRIFNWFAMGLVHPIVEAHGDERRVRFADLRYGVDTDPSRSLFGFEAVFDAAGFLVASRLVDFPIGDGRARLTGLFDAAYAACRG